jgi:hypothetical protein
MKKIIDTDVLTGTTRIFHYDPAVDDRHFFVQTVQRTDALVEANKREINEAAPLKKSGKETLVKVASIPLSLYMELRRKGIAQDPAAMRKWLNDPDNRVFRTREGVV